MATLPNTPRTQTITLASATAGPFDITLRLFSDDLRVTVNDLETGAYTLSTTYADGYDDDATITFDAALEIGDVVVIDPVLPPARDVNYSPTEPGLTAKLNIELVRIWSVLQQFTRDFTRSLKLPSNATQSEEIAASTGPFHVLASNADNTGYEFVPAADAGVTFDPALFVAKTEVGSVAQAWDADLDALAALATTGITARTGAATYAQRSITGTADRIAVTYGNGVSGNPTIDVVKASTANAEAGTGDGVMDPVLTKAAVNAQVPDVLNAGGTAPLYGCRAWVNFNGTGTVTIRASGNVSSITDNGTGDYTVNFATAMPDAYYVPTLTSSGAIQNIIARTTTSVRVKTADNTNTFQGHNEVFLGVIR